MTRPRLTAATTLAATLAAALALTAPRAWAEDRTPATLTVTGEGMTEVAPDLATLSIGVTTTGETAAEALAANSAALDAVLQRLKAAGVEDRDLQTANLSVNPNWSSYDSSSSGAQTIDGYTAMNVVSVRIRALEGLGAVLDAAVTDGANTLNGLTFGLSEPRPAQDAARKAATTDARARAELLAEAAGVKLGRILSISEGASFADPAPMYKAADAVAAPVPVEAGEIGMNAAVTITFEIVQ